MNNRASIPLTFLVLSLLSVAFCTHASMAAATNPVVLMQTSMGDIKIELYADKAPITVMNFLDYAKLGFYNNTLFHRVIFKFMIQGGGVTSDLKEKTTRASIRNEAANGLSNLRGTIAMAREEEPNSATSQFFINLVDNKRLDHTGSVGRTFGYAVFGKVIEGMEVVDKIGATPTKRVSADYMNVPMTPVVIKAVRIIAQ